MNNIDKWVDDNQAEKNNLKADLKELLELLINEHAGSTLIDEWGRSHELDKCYTCKKIEEMQRKYDNSTRH